LSIHLQRIWKETFNQTWAKYPGDEGRCAATAWSVVNNARGKKSEELMEGELQMPVVAFVDSPMDMNASWDAGAEFAKAPEFADRKPMCTLWDGTENLSGLKLPHHSGDSGHRAIWRGVAAAMAALLGARGGVKGISPSDKAGAYNHLSKHYKKAKKVAPDKTKSLTLSEADCFNLTSRFEHNLQLFNGDENAALLKSLDEVWDSKLT
jgi:hypothetical protein